MQSALHAIEKLSLKPDLPILKPGQTVRIGQKIQEGEKSRIQYFEGVIIAKHKKTNINSSITVRKIVDGIGVEKVFPIHSPIVAEIEILREAKVRRSKLFYLRNLTGKAAKLKFHLEGPQSVEKKSDPTAVSA